MNSIGEYLREDDIWIERIGRGWSVMGRECYSEPDLRSTYTECEDVEISDNYDNYVQAYEEKHKLLNRRKNELESLDFLKLRYLPKLILDAFELIIAGLALATYILKKK